MPKNTENIKNYYKNVIEIINNFINAKSNEFDAVKDLYELNNSYENIIADEDLITSIPRTHYGMDIYMSYLFNPQGYSEDIQYMKEHWVPSSFC